MPLHLASQALDTALPAGAVVMLNLLRYRDRAQYDGMSELPPCTGREAYFGRYVPAFGRLTEGQAIAPIWLGTVGGVLVAPEGERWDDVALVRYPDVETFRRVVEGAAYRREAEPHRLAALADWRLIATSELALPRRGS